MGRTLNIHGEMAASPAVIGAYQGIGAAIREHGSFDARAREAIALAVGAVDGCDYCQAAHTLSAREAAVNVGSVTDQAWDTALAAGWTDAELAEAFAHLVANLFTNYFNHYARTDLDVPAAPGLPLP